MKIKGLCICGHRRERHWLPEGYDIDDKKHMCAQCEIVEFEADEGKDVQLMTVDGPEHLFVTAELI